MATNTKQLASELASKMGVELPESIDDIIAGMNAGVSAKAVREYREYTEKHNSKVQEEWVELNETPEIHVVDKIPNNMTAFGILPKKNMSEVKFELEQRAEMMSESRRLQYASNDDLQNQPADEPLPVAIRRRNYDTDEKKCHETVEKRELVSMSDSIVTMRNVRSLVESGADADAIIDAINVAIATALVATERSVITPRNKSALPFPEWTADGYQLVMHSRPSAKLKDKYAEVGNPNAYKKHTKPAKLTDEIKSDFNYYIDAVAFDSNGREYRIYVGSYATVLKIATEGRLVVAHDIATQRESVHRNGGFKGGNRSRKPIEEIDAVTLEWRIEQAKKRNEDIVKIR